jgi:hypothetical protein
MPACESRRVYSYSALWTPFRRFVAVRPITFQMETILIGALKCEETRCSIRYQRLLREEINCVRHKYYDRLMQYSQCWWKACFCEIMSHSTEFLKERKQLAIKIDPAPDKVDESTSAQTSYSSFFFSYGSTAPWGPRPPHFSRLHDHTQTHHSR